MKLPPDKDSLATMLRCLLIFEIVSAVLCLPIGIAADQMGEQTLLEAGLVSPEVNMFVAAMYIVMIVILLPVAIASWVGLFRLKNWDRWLYLAGLVIGTLLNLFTSCFTWTYSWDLVGALFSITSLVEGFIVAICFLSPLATEFERPTITTSK